MQSLAYIFSNMNYYSFGMLMPGRKYATATYRFGFNGKENVNEIDGIGNSVDFGARMYDSRLGRWLSIDNLQMKYPSHSGYNVSLCNPIYFKDSDGKVVIGTDGMPVTFTKDDKGNVTGFSDNLDRNSDAFLVLSNLITTKTGEKSARNFLERQTVYSFKVTNEKFVPTGQSGPVHGSTEPAKDEKGNAIINKDGTYESALVTISTADLQDRLKGATPEMLINVVAVHEGDGHTDPAQILIENTYGSDKQIDDWHTYPFFEEKNAVHDYLQSKPEVAKTFNIKEYDSRLEKAFPKYTEFNDNDPSTNPEAEGKTRHRSTVKDYNNANKNLPKH
jgi:RHS repeat-associated protein